MTDNTETAPQEEQNEATPGGDPVRKWTIRILVLCVVLLAGYLTADRLTPVSSQARIHSLVVPVAAEVAGIVAEVAVENNQAVQAGDVYISEMNVGLVGKMFGGTISEVMGDASADIARIISAVSADQ